MISAQNESIYIRRGPTEQKCDALAKLAIQEAMPILYAEGGVQHLLAGVGLFISPDLIHLPAGDHGKGRN